MIQRPAAILTGTHRWRGYALATALLAALAAGAVCGTGSPGAAPTAPGGTPPSTVGAAPTVIVPPRPTMPPLPVRTVVPGLAKGGLFADGVTGLARVSTTAWKTYTNATYGFTFKYPADWQFSETDSAGHHGPNGEPAYPLHSVSVKNPAAEQGKKIPGVNCSIAGNDCAGPPPGLLAFQVEIIDVPCLFAGIVVASGSAVVGDAPGERCVVEYPNDRSRTVVLAFPLGDGRNFIAVVLERGNAVAVARQAVLETILSTFAFTGRTSPPVATP